MSKVSVLIPSRNEKFLTPTIKDVLAKAAGNVEVIVNIDEKLPAEIVEDKRVQYIYQDKPVGMRAGINACASLATGKYLMKLDAHCEVGEGFDDILASEMEDNWVVVPRRYSLDPELWKIDRHRPAIDYHYLSYPLADEGGGFGLHGRYWRERCLERKDILNDIEMTSQGSAWLMSRKHWDWLGGLGIEGYGDFIQEFQEIGCKTWLGGGEVRVNKKTWYAHLHKGATHGRGYFISRSSWSRGLYYSADFWINNRWKDRRRDFEWLIEKFNPVPTWPENWRELLPSLQGEIKQRYDIHYQS